MLHIFVDAASIQGNLLTITGTEVNHIRNVMRMKVGEEISVSTGEEDKEYRFEIKEFLDDRILCELVSIASQTNELPAKVYLFQGLPKSDKMDLIVQKAVELGVFEIIPVETARCVVKLDEKKADKKIQRWQKISESAAMQSKRNIIPKISEPMSFQRAIAYAEQNSRVRVIPYELQKDEGSTKKLLESIENGEGVSIFIGPEGGFEEREIDEAVKAGIVPISLGKRILRTETAGLSVLSWLTYILEIG